MTGTAGGCGPWAELDPLLAYAVLRLRSDVFVVEQQCVYPDVDGRDVEATTVHHWRSDAGDPHEVLAYLRVLADPEGRRIGRVVTALAARGRGLAAALVADVVASSGGVTLVLDAQSHATNLYARNGFVVTGPEFLEDGIAHVPMRRDASA